MKKSIFTLLVVALAAPMMFNSCKGGGGDDPTPTPSDLPVPPKAADAIKVVINPPATQPLKDYPVSFEYTETGKAIVGFKSPLLHHRKRFQERKCLHDYGARWQNIQI